MATVDLRVWAIRGAEQRLVEIATEAKAIIEAFPELRKKQGRGLGSSGSTKDLSSIPASDAPAPRKRRRMSAAARKRIGDAQRKRWAEKRAKASPAADQPTASSAKTTSGAGARRKGAKKRTSRKNRASR